MSGESGPTRKMLLATREVTVIIHGIEYDALLVPRKDLVEIDFSQFPEDDPLRRHVNIQRLTEAPLILGEDFTFVPDEDGGSYRLTEEAAKRLLESL